MELPGVVVVLLLQPGTGMAILSKVEDFACVALNTYKFRLRGSHEEEDELTIKSLR